MKVAAVVHLDAAGARTTPAGRGIHPTPALVVVSEGAADGSTEPRRCRPGPRPRGDDDGCGDCFAAALTCALAEGRSPAAALAAAHGAPALTRRGAHGTIPAG